MADVAEPPTSFREALKQGAQRDLQANGGTPPEQPPVAPPAATTPPPEPIKPSVTPTPTPQADPDDEIISGKRSPKSEDFKRVKTAASAAAKERDDYKAKVADYDAQLKAAKKAGESSGELEKIRKERDDYKSQVEVVALEFMPEFQAKYQSRIDKATNSLKEVLPADVYAKVAQVLEGPQNDFARKQLAELTADLDQIQVGEVMATAREIRAINGERQAERANAQTKLGEIVESRTKVQKERESALVKTFEDTFEKAAKENPLFKKREGDSKEVREWNDSIVERKEVAMQVFRGSLEPGQMAEAALAVSSTHVLVGELKAAAGRVVELEAVIAKLQGSGPALDGGGVDGDGKGAKTPFWKKVGGNNG